MCISHLSNFIVLFAHMGPTCWVKFKGWFWGSSMRWKIWVFLLQSRFLELRALWPGFEQRSRKGMDLLSPSLPYSCNHWIIFFPDLWLWSSDMMFTRIQILGPHIAPLSAVDPKDGMLARPLWGWGDFPWNTYCSSLLSFRFLLNLSPCLPVLSPWKPLCQ